MINSGCSFLTTFDVVVEDCATMNGSSFTSTGVPVLVAATT